MIDLLAGADSDDTSDAHQQMIEDMIRIFEAQKLVSLTTLFDLADNLESVGKGEKLNTALTGEAGHAHLRNPVAAQRHRRGTEKNSMAFGYWTERTSTRSAN